MPDSGPARGICARNGHAAALDLAVVALGGGRRVAADTVDPAVGLTGLSHSANAYAAGEPLATVHTRAIALRRTKPSRPFSKRSWFVTRRCPRPQIAAIHAGSIVFSKEEAMPRTSTLGAGGNPQRLVHAAARTERGQVVDPRAPSRSSTAAGEPRRAELRHTGTDRRRKATSARRCTAPRMVARIQASQGASLSQAAHGKPGYGYGEPCVLISPATPRCPRPGSPGTSPHGLFR